MSSFTSFLSVLFSILSEMLLVMALLIDEVLVGEIMIGAQIVSSILHGTHILVILKQSLF
jgi:hypothetical protein